MYQSPHLWFFKEQVNSSAAGFLQVYSSNLTDLAGRVMSRNYACYTGTEHRACLVHFGKWLYYKNVTGKSAILKPYNANLGDEVSLSDVSENGGGVVDLANSVEWLVPGMVYYVEEVMFAIEMESL